MKRRAAEVVDGQYALVWMISSVLLQYPDDRMYARLDDVAAAVGEVRDAKTHASLLRLLDWLRSQPRTEAAQHYVATFDLTRRCSPYLTYYRYGDTRQRGMALLAVKQAYRSAGLEPPSDELPDYLPAVLEFAAMVGEDGHRLLESNRAGLELLRLALADAGSPYAAALDVVCAALPRISERVAADVRRLAADGPPKENVGLDPVGTEPFAPPEFMTGSGIGATP